jgi:hypothetical protein
MNKIFSTFKLINLKKYVGDLKVNIREFLLSLVMIKKISKI